MESIETYCERGSSQPPESLDFEQKRLELEVLDIQVVVDGKEVIIRGDLTTGNSTFSPLTPYRPVGNLNTALQA